MANIYRDNKNDPALDEKFMKEALKQAAKALELGETPIGCVIARDNKIYSRGYNRRNTDHTTLGHAEITAIKKASKKFGDWRLEDCTLYVTLEPCPMCAGAIAWAQLSRLVYAAADPKRGFTNYSPSLLHPKTQVTAGVLEQECRHILQIFFSDKR